jgi:hypothetical protein
MRAPQLIFIGIISLFLLLLLQSMLPVVKVRPLQGAVSIPEKPEFSWKGWFEGTYQQQEEEYFNETFGFRNIFVRINNQLDYSLFKIIHAKDVIEGKEGYLYELNYFKAYNGEDYKGLQFIEEMINKIKVIQDSLKKRGVDFVLVLAPGKASFFPEYIPDSYSTKLDTTNYEVLVPLAIEKGINVLDLNSLFISQRNISKYPLFPQYSIHWSIYGATVAMDTILKFIEKVRGVDMPEIRIDSMEWVHAYRPPDYDIADGMNMLFRKKTFPMGYPHVTYVRENKAKEKVLAIADSYYWTIYGNGVAWELFDDPEFWFLYNELHSVKAGGIIPREQIDLRTVLEKQDVVMLLGTEANYSRLGWGFVDDAYALYTASFSTFSRIREIEASIRATPSWFNAIREKAFARGIDLDSMIHMDAEYVYEQERLKQLQ